MSGWYLEIGYRFLPNAYVLMATSHAIRRITFSVETALLESWKEKLFLSLLMCNQN
jgi:hypothetical protein